MLHLKRTALFKKKSKNQNSFVMLSESPLKRKLEILSMPSKRNTIRLHITALLSSLENKVISNEPVTMESLVEQLGYRC